jgi:TonB family protein
MLCIGISMVVAAAAAPLPASGSWVLERSPGICTIQQSYGTGPAETLLGLQQFVLADGASLLLVSPEAKAVAPHFGRLTLRLGAAMSTPRYDAWSIAEKHLRVTRFTIDSAAVQAFRSSATVAVETDDGLSIALQLDQTEAAFGMLGHCQDALVVEAGLDPSVMKRAATPAKLENGDNIVAVADYPVAALRANQQGTVIVVGTINVHGRVEHCRTIVSSGSAALDQKTCDIVTNRARYTPARDTAGVPVPSYMSKKVIWSIP